MNHEKAHDTLRSDQTVLNSEDVRGQVAYIEMLLRDLEPYQVRRAVFAQYGAACSHILRRIETGRFLRDSPPTHRDPIVRGISRIRSTALGTPLPDVPNGYWSRDALEDAICSRVQSIIADRVAFKAILEHEYATMPLPHANRLRRVVKEIHNGLGLIGIELSDAMRNARNEALEFVAAGERERYPIGWFLLGWLCLHGTFCADATSHFANGLNVIGQRNDLLTRLLHRYLALALDANDRHAEAYETVKGALALRSDETLLLEAARYSARSGHSAKAWRYVENAIQLNPVCVYEAMAEEDLASVEGAVLIGYGHALEIVRKQANQACSDWQSAIDQARAAEKKIGTSLELPSDMTTGVNQLRRDVGSGDLSDAFGICAAARFVRRELLEACSKRIGSLVANRDADLDEVRRHRAQVIARIDAKLERSNQDHEAMRRGLAASARSADPHGELVAAGYCTAAKSALLILIAFPIIVRASAILGHELASGSVALLALGLLSIPVITAMGTQFAISIRHSSAESDVKRQEVILAKRFQRNQKRIEEERIAQSKEMSEMEAALETRSSAAGDAIRLLQLATTTDPASSQLAA